MTKNKIKTTLLILFAFVFVLSTAILGFSIVDGKTYAEEHAITDVSVNVDNGIRVAYTVNLPEGYTVPTLQIERGSHAVTLKTYTETSDGIVFSYGGVRAAAMDEEINATLYATNADGANVKVDENTFKVSDYFANLLAKSAEESDLADNHFAYMAQRAYAANALYLGEKATGNSLSLSDADRKLLVFADENNYNGNDWPLRDNLTLVDGENASGFSWVGLPTFDLNQGFYLRYNFTASDAIASDLRVKIEFLGETHWTIPVQTGTKTYGFGYAFDATEFCFDAQVTVYNGDTPISATVGYSVNRALAYGSTFGDNQTKTLASATWAFGKAAVWYTYESEMEYVLLPNLTDNGIYASFMFDYVYDSDMMLTEGMGKSSPAIWVNGTGYDADDTTTADGYAVSFSDDVFTVTLDGVQNANGIVAPDGDLNIVVAKDSSVSGGYYRNWDDKNSRTVSTVGATGNITISGDSGATLTIYGRMLADNVIVTGNVNVVVVIDQSNMNGVEANTLTMSDGASLDVSYVGDATAMNAGIRTIADITLDGAKLTVTDFMYAIQLGGDQADREVDFTVTNSEISLACDNYGITAVEIPGADWNGWQATRWTVTLTLDEGSDMAITGERGTRFTNIVLGDANLNVSAIYNGIGDEWAPATLTTTSGDFEVGTLTVTVANDNTGAYAMVASAMDVDGGTITFISGNMDGVLMTTNGSVWNLANCDMFVKTTSVSTPMVDMDGNTVIARTYGIQAESADEQINIKTSARLIIQDCDLAIRCWLPTEYFNPVVITLEGYLAIDNYLASQYPWDWGITAQIKDADGNDAYDSVRYSNQRFED